MLWGDLGDGGRVGGGLDGGAAAGDPLADQAVVLVAALAAAEASGGAEVDALAVGDDERSLGRSVTR